MAQSYLTHVTHPWRPFPCPQGHPIQNAIQATWPWPIRVDVFAKRMSFDFFYMYAVVYNFCKLFCVSWQSNKECSYLVGSYLKYMRTLFRCFLVPSLPRFFSSKHHPPYPSDCLPARLPWSCPCLLILFRLNVCEEAGSAPTSLLIFSLWLREIVRII